MGSHTETAAQRDGRGVFLLSLVVVCLIGAFDLLVGEHTVLIELLLLGPVVAAFGATSSQTAIVALFALGVAIPLTLINSDLGESDQLTRLAAVGLVGGLTVGIARLRSDRERDAARLSVQYGLARILADADSLEEAGPRMLRGIAEPLGWDVAHLWEAQGGAVLRPTAAWTRPGVNAEEFEEVSFKQVMGPGFGLPGEVWESGLPAWFPDVLSSDQFTRVESARKAGLRGALAFPIRVHGEAVAVVELFAREPREPDPELLVLTDTLGSADRRLRRGRGRRRSGAPERRPQVGGAELLARRHHHDRLPRSRGRVQPRRRADLRAHGQAGHRRRARRARGPARRCASATARGCGTSSPRARASCSAGASSSPACAPTAASSRSSSPSTAS